MSDDAKIMNAISVCVNNVIRNILARSLKLPVNSAAKIKPTYIASILKERFTIIFAPSFDSSYFYFLA